MQYLPGDLAQLQVDDEAGRRRMAMAQSLQQAGFNPVQGGNPLLAMLSSVMSTVQGGRMMNEADAKASEIMAKRFEIENQRAQQEAEAERARRLEDRQWKREDTEFGAQTTAKYAQRNIDPLSPEGIAAALGLERGKIGMKPQGGPSTPEFQRKIDALVAAGMPVGEATKAVVLGAQGGGGANAPSGYRATPDGGLEPIPGGPADKPPEVNPRAGLANDALRFVAATTGTPIETLQGMTPAQVAEEFQKKSTTMSNPILGRLPGAGMSTEAIRKEMAAKQARINNPKGTVTDPDFRAAEASLPSIDRPDAVNAEIILNMLTQAGAGGQAPQPQAAPSQGAPPMPKSDAEYAALPSGTKYIDPDDGKTYRKP